MSHDGGAPATSTAAPDDLLEELAELRLRVAAQDRLIAAMLEENESIHVIRRHYESRRWYHLLEGTVPYRVAVAVRNLLRSVARRVVPALRRLPATVLDLATGGGR